MTENSLVAARQNRRHPPSLEAEPGMANCVDPTMQSMQLTLCDSIFDRLPSNLHRQELPPRHDTMLPRSKLSEVEIGRGGFCTHVEL